MTWYGAATPEEQERLSSAWLSAPIEQTEVCQMILDVAKEQVIVFAGSAIAEDPAAETRLVYAQLQQAKNLWNAGRADENANVGTEGYSFVPRPLDKTIRQIIRPVGRLSIG